VLAQVNAVTQLTITGTTTTVAGNLTVNGTVNNYTMTAGNSISWATGSSVGDSGGSLTAKGNSGVNLSIAGTNKVAITAALTTLSSTTVTVSGTMNSYTMTSGNSITFGSSTVSDAAGTFAFNGSSSVVLQIGGVTKATITSALTTLASTTVTVSGTMNTLTMTSGNALQFASSANEIFNSGGAMLINSTGAVDIQASGTTKVTITAATATFSSTALQHNGTTLGFYSTTAIAQQTGIGATLTNSVTSSGTSNTLSDFAASSYATDAATIHGNFYQLGQKVKNLETQIKALGLIVN
jgi:hypothetical protein